MTIVSRICHVQCCNVLQHISNMIQHAAKWRTTHRKTTYRAYQPRNPSVHSVHLYKASKNHSRNMSFELTPSFSVNSLWSPWTTCNRFSCVSPMNTKICGVAGFKSNLVVHGCQNKDPTKQQGHLTNHQQTEIWSWLKVTPQEF